MLTRLRTTARSALTTLKSVRQLPTALAVVRRDRRAPAYLLYLCLQLEKSRAYATKVSTRTGQLVGKLIAGTKAPGTDLGRLSVLCVGCRNVHELRLLRSAGYGSVTGIDLFASSPEILAMDMHALEFRDDQFDVVYACHSLEHSINPEAAVREIIRVAKSGAVVAVEVPVRFSPSTVDLQDYRSVDGVRALFGPHVGEVVLAEEDPNVARLLFRVAKPAGAAVER
jgi:SAM-dependent methyltransferase